MSDRLVERLILGLVVLCSLLVLSPGVADPDLWGHVQYGRDVLRDGELPTTSTYTYTAEGYRWINHENIPELAMAWTVDTLGVGGLIALRLGLALFVVVTILVWNLRAGCSLMVSSAVTLLMAWNLGFHFSYRPQLATIVCFVAMMLVIELAFVGWRDRWILPAPHWLKGWLGKNETVPASGDGLGYQARRGKLLWLMPLIMLVWTNSHGGFLAGLLIYIAILGLRAVEAIWIRGRQSEGLVKRLVLMAVVAALATLVNPYTFRLHSWTLASVLQPRPEISDWSASHLLTLTGMKFWVLLGASLFALAYSRRPRDLVQLVVGGLITWQALTHFRHVQFFAVLAGFWLGPHLQSALERWAPAGAVGASGSLRGQRWPIAGVVALCAVVIGGLVPRLSTIRVARNEYPVDAIQFMADRGLSGRTVVTFDWAQYYLAARCADGAEPSLVGMDGRFDTCYPQTVIDAHFDFILGDGPGTGRFRSPSSPACDPARVLELDRPELVLNRRFNEQSEQVMEGQKRDWVLLYQDSVAQVWGRRDKYDDPQSPDYLPESLRQTDGRLVTGFAAWPALPLQKIGNAPGAQPRYAGITAPPVSGSAH